MPLTTWLTHTWRRGRHPRHDSDKNDSDKEDDAPPAPRSRPGQAHRRGDRPDGSIIIPDSAKEKPQEGKVIAVGTGKVDDDGKKTPLDVKAGDRVLFGKYSGSEVKLDGEEYLIMKEEDLLGVLRLVNRRPDRC